MLFCSPKREEEVPEFLKMKLRSAPKPRDYDCPHNSGREDTLLSKITGQSNNNKIIEQPKPQPQEELVVEEQQTEEIIDEALEEIPSEQAEQDVTVESQEILDTEDNETVELEPEPLSEEEAEESNVNQDD